MIRLSLTFTVGLLFASLGFSTGKAQPVFFADTGNAYELVPDRFDWPTARQLAESMTYQGMSGRLATVNSQAENDFLIATFSSPEAWLGGFQVDGSVEPAGGFRWITDEPFSYTNWGAFDPGNNSGDPLNLNEKYISLVGNGNWNDLAGPPQTAPGYYIEYVGVPEPTSLAILATCGLMALGRRQRLGHEFYSV